MHWHTISRSFHIIFLGYFFFCCLFSFLFFLVIYVFFIFLFFCVFFSFSVKKKYIYNKKIKTEEGKEEQVEPAAGV